MSLDELRKKIDGLDDQIIQLLNERTNFVLDIGKIKDKEGKEIYSPEREYEIYRKIDKISKGPLPADSLKIIYREIMSAALSVALFIAIIRAAISQAIFSTTARYTRASV